MKNGFIVLMITIGLLGLETLRSDVTHIKRSEDNSMFDVTNDPWQPEEFKKATVIPASFVKEPGIVLDGKDDEAEWGKALEIPVPLSYGLVDKAWIKALYSDDKVFIRVRWEDVTEDRDHHPWVWDSEGEQYVEGLQVEDSIILSIEAGCWWAPSFLEGYVFDFDGWQWLAARSDPVGQAVDIDGSIQDRDLTVLGFTQYQSRNSEDVWNLKFTEEEEDSFHKSWDELDRTYLHQPSTGTVYYRGRPDGSDWSEFGEKLPMPQAAPAGETQTFPQFKAVPLEGDAGQVTAKGHWESGSWTVEFSRTLSTPRETVTDSVFSRLTQFSVHIFDHVERIDQSSESGRLFLQFMEKELLLTKE
jgi:hypothetical protein